MSYSRTANELFSLSLVDPPRFRARILEAFRATDGNAVHAAERLKIGHRTLLRYMEDTTLSREIEAIRTARKSEVEASRIREEEARVKAREAREAARQHKADVAARSSARTARATRRKAARKAARA